MRKRILLFAIIFILTIPFAFSKSADLDLVSDVAESSLTYDLYRDLNNELVLIEENSDYLVDSVKPLTEDSKIDNFSIRVNSNLNYSKVIKAKVNPGSFVMDLDNSEKFDSGVKPIITTTVDENIVKAGVNKDKEVYRFNILVNGKEDLPAGKYLCLVNVEYVIE